MLNLQSVDPVILSRPPGSIGVVGGCSEARVFFLPSLSPRTQTSGRKSVLSAFFYASIMRCAKSAISWLISALLLTLSSTLAAADTTRSTVTVYAWPLSTPSPTSFATIVLEASQTAPIAEVKSVRLPSISPSKDELVRVGLYDSATKQWTGTATAASSFAQGLGRKLTLHVDDNGEVYHAALSAYTLPGKSKKKDVLDVEVVPKTPGAQPILNKPVALNADGKVPQPEQKDERSFLQK